MIRIILGSCSLLFSLVYIFGSSIRFIENEIKSDEILFVIILGIVFILITVFLFFPFIQNKHKHVEKTYSSEALIKAKKVFEIISHCGLVPFLPYIRPNKFDEVNKAFSISNIDGMFVPVNDEQEIVFIKVKDKARRDIDGFKAILFFYIIEYYFDGNKEKLGSLSDFKYFGNKKIWSSELGLFSEEIRKTLPDELSQFNWNNNSNDLVRKIDYQSIQASAKKLILFCEKNEFDISKVSNEINLKYSSHNNIIYCPFCFKEIKTEINKCLGCGETLLKNK